MINFRSNIFTVTILLSVFASSQGLVRGESTFSCEVLPDTPDARHSPIVVSNLKEVRARARLKPVEYSDALANDMVRGSKLKISITSLPSNSIASATVKSISPSYDLGVLTIVGSFTIPVDEAERKRAISSHIEGLVNPKPQSSRVPPAITDYLRANRAQLETIHDAMYVENKPGHYQLTCEYTLIDGRHFVSDPIDFEISFKGHFFDQPQFRFVGPGKPTTK